MGSDAKSQSAVNDDEQEAVKREGAVEIRGGRHEIIRTRKFIARERKERPKRVHLE